jgi:HEAT repeat protein
MTRPKTPSSTNRQQEAEDRAAVEAALESFDSDIDRTTKRLEVERLSDLTRAGAACLRDRWLDLPSALRRRVVHQMVSEAEEQVERNYDRAMLVAMDDPETDIRLAALEGLWEYDDPSLLASLLERIIEEPDDTLRGTMTEALGRFALLAELGQLDEPLVERLRETLLTLLEDESTTVRQRAIEGAGYFADDRDVIEAIEDAYASRDTDSRASALRAMGRQADPRWVESIGVEFSSHEPELRYEAARAAGQNGDPRLVPGVIDLTADEDLEVRLAAIAALGQLGGRLAVNALRRLVQSQTPAVADAAEDALNEAYLTTGELRPPV